MVENSTYYGGALDNIIVTPGAVIPEDNYPVITLQAGLIGILGTVFLIQRNKEL
jgi:hypothetical protein